METTVLRKVVLYFNPSALLLTGLFACSKLKIATETTDRNERALYVAVDGNDANNGTINAPFGTINYALSKASAGDTVFVRAGTYTNRVIFGKSGLLGKPITLKAYPGERPLIDGSQTTATGLMAMVSFPDVKFLTIEGFDIAHFQTQNPGVDPMGISITGNSRDIDIRNCNIFDIKNFHLTNRSAHAIFVLGNGSEVMRDINITGCTVHDTQTGTSENVTFAGNVDGFTFTHNKIYDTENIGVIVAGGDNLHPTGDIRTNYARNGVVSDNEVYQVSMTKSTNYWGLNNYGAIGIYVCGGAGTIIERNTVYNCDRGIGLVSESNQLATKTCIVRNNFVYNCNRTGIYLGDYLNYTTGGTQDCYVVNNTLFQNNKFLGHFGEIEGEIRLTERCTNNVIRNNIIYARPTDVFIHKYTATGSGNIIDNNLYFTNGAPKWIWDGTAYSDYNVWKTASAQDAHSSSGVDPMLVSISQPDLRIQPGSSARNSGTLTSEAVNGKTDIDNKPRTDNGKISKGAQQ